MLKSLNIVCLVCTELFHQVLHLASPLKIFGYLRSLAGDPCEYLTDSEQVAGDFYQFHHSPRWNGLLKCLSSCLIACKRSCLRLRVFLSAAV